jgi:hypothetical protein
MSAAPFAALRRHIGLQPAPQHGELRARRQRR